MATTSKPRTLIWDLMGEKPATVSMPYSPAERIWFDSEYGCGLSTFGFSRVPRWNDRLVIGKHTYRVTHVSYKDSSGQRYKYPFVATEWFSSTVSIEDELRELQKSVLCKDCQIDVVADGMFMVHNPIWLSAVPEGYGTLLCLACFQGRLGRLVTADDLTDALLNWDLRRRLNRGLSA